MTEPMPRKAVLIGMLSGAVAMAAIWAGVVFPRWTYVGIWDQLIESALPVLASPVAAAVSAIAMRARPRRVLGFAALALPVAFLFVSASDYIMLMVLLSPGSAFQGKPEWSAAEVERVARSQLVTRHAVATVLGLLGASLLGVRAAGTRKGA